jgi:hypothetical protein
MSRTPVLRGSLAVAARAELPRPLAAGEPLPAPPPARAEGALPNDVL